jgi:hypothetical protein
MEVLWSGVCKNRGLSEGVFEIKSILEDRIMVWKKNKNKNKVVTTIFKFMVVFLPFLFFDEKIGENERL